MVKLISPWLRQQAKLRAYIHTRFNKGGQYDGRPRYMAGNT